MSTNAHVRAPPERLVSKQRRVGAPTEATSVESLVSRARSQGGVLIVSGHGMVTKWSCKMDM